MTMSLISRLVTTALLLIGLDVLREAPKLAIAWVQFEGGFGHKEGVVKALLLKQE
jgi:hypothetical protein